MYRYDAVKDYVEYVFRRLNVEFQPGRGCCGVDEPALVIRQERLGRYLFFLREDLPIWQKNEAVGIELARIVLGHHSLTPRSDEARRDEAHVRRLFAARLLLPAPVVKRAIEERWTTQRLAEEALVSAELAAFRLEDFRHGQRTLPTPKPSAVELSRYRAFFEAHLARPG